jgi:hypothetical protein
VKNVKLLLLNVKLLDGTATTASKQPVRSAVAHLQAPDIRSTFLRFPSEVAGRLDITLPHLHLQVKNLDRPFFVDIGVRDDRAVEGVIRLSTFQARRGPFHLPSLCTHAFFMLIYFLSYAADTPTSSPRSEG